MTLRGAAGPRTYCTSGPQSRGPRRGARRRRSRGGESRERAPCSTSEADTCPAAGAPGAHTSGISVEDAKNVRKGAFAVSSMILMFTEADGCFSFDVAPKATSIDRPG